MKLLFFRFFLERLISRLVSFPVGKEKKTVSDIKKKTIQNGESIFNFSFSQPLKSVDKLTHDDIIRKRLTCGFDASMAAIITTKRPTPMMAIAVDFFILGCCGGQEVENGKRMDSTTDTRGSNQQIDCFRSLLVVLRVCVLAPRRQTSRDNSKGRNWRRF